MIQGIKNLGFYSAVLNSPTPKHAFTRLEHQVTPSETKKIDGEKRLTSHKGLKDERMKKRRNTIKTIG